MPDMVRVRNITTDDLAVGLLGRAVAADSIADFPGRVVAENDDHYLIETGNPPVEHAWPKATWSVETPTRKKGS